MATFILFPGPIRPDAFFLELSIRTPRTTSQTTEFGRWELVIEIPSWVLIWNYIRKPNRESRKKFAILNCREIGSSIQKRMSESQPPTAKIQSIRQTLKSWEGMN